MTTEAGKRLLDWAHDPQTTLWQHGFRGIKSLRPAILAIEAEAEHRGYLRANDCDHSDCIDREERLRKIEEAARAVPSLLREAIEVVHQTDSLRSHADPNDHFGWNLHGIETCADLICVEGLVAEAALRAALEAER